MNRSVGLRLVLPVVATIILAACDSHVTSIRGSGMLVTEHRDVEPFDEIAIQGGLPVSVTVNAGASHELSVTIDGNLIELVDQRVVGGTLTIRALEPFRQSRRAVITVSTPELRAISASGGSDVTVTGVTVQQFSIQSSGGADIHASGTAGTLTADASGGAELHLRDLHVVEATLVASGGADIYATVTQAVEATATGGADIRVYGDPLQVSVESSGGGKVDFR
jgi:hypothetical protein